MNKRTSPENFAGYENNLSQEQHKEEEKDAIEIVKECDYPQAILRLKEEGIFEHQLLQTKDLYEKELSDALFLTEKDWEMITVIMLYSPELAEHSIETYKLLRSKIENISIGSESIADAIVQEHGSLDKFYRASVLHDIGKTAIPESVLNHTLVPGDWQALKTLRIQEFPQEWVHTYLGLHVGENFENFDIETYSKKFKVNPISTVPVSHYLPENELAKLTQRNISTDLTLREIFEMHEPESQKMLENEGLPVEGAVVGQHHNYKHEPYIYPISAKTIGLSTNYAALLSWADRQQALISNRPYKKGYSLTKATSIILEEEKLKEIKDQELAALWIQDDIEKGKFAPETDKDIERFNDIQAFVKKYHPEAEKLSI